AATSRSTTCSGWRSSPSRASSSTARTTTASRRPTPPSALDARPPGLHRSVALRPEREQRSGSAGMKPNRMKTKLAAGAPALGCSVMFPSPQLVEMLGFAGFDWVLLDCEHGSLSPADVELMCIAADAAGITPIGRPRLNTVIDI